MAEQGEREQQEGWAEEQNGDGVRVTETRGTERKHGSDGSKARERGGVEAEQQSGKVKGVSTARGSEPLSVWKHGVSVKGHRA